MRINDNCSHTNHGKQQGQKEKHGCDQFFLPQGKEDSNGDKNQGIDKQAYYHDIFKTNLKAKITIFE